MLLIAGGFKSATEHVATIARYLDATRCRFLDWADQVFPYSHVYLGVHNVVGVVFVCPLSTTYGSRMGWDSHSGSL